MTLSYEDLTTPITEEEAEADNIEILSDAGFTATSWQSGSSQLTFLKLASFLKSKLSEYVEAVAKLGNNEDATGEGLTRYSASVYDNTRTPATKTVGQMQFAVAAGEGPHTVNVGDMVVTDGVSTYRNTTSDTLTSAAAVPLTMEAEVAGSLSVIPPSTSLSLVTSFSGVSVTNPAISGSGTWMTNVGVDKESDPNLQLRNSTKWATLGAGDVVYDRVINLMLNAHTDIKKVVANDDNPRGVYTADAYIGGETSLVGNEALNAAQAALDGAFFKNQTVGQNPRVMAFKTTAVPLTVVGTVYYDSNIDESVITANVEAALLAFIKSVPIGGFNYPPALVNVVTVGDVQQAIENASGVLTADIITPAATLSFSLNEQLVPPASYSLTYSAVSKQFYNG